MSGPRRDDWDMAKRTLPHGFEDIQREEGARIFGRVASIRLLLAPVVFAIAVLVALHDVAPWRQAVLLGLTTFLLLLSIIEVVRFRRRGLRPYVIPLNLGAGVFGQLVIVAITGGLESPIIPVQVMFAVLIGMLIEYAWVRRVLLALQIGAVWSFALMATQGWIATLNPSLFGGGSRAGHTDWLLWTYAGALTTIFLVAELLGTGQRGVLDTMLRRGLEAREESLRAYAERNRELVALGGEIAHELKNPLASVNGLAALLARDISDEKSAARLGVLRREVTRMHGILEEFLTFSRPLVPLSLEQTDLWALAREVVLLHEGMAHDREVALDLQGEGRALCDPRKIKQILINLVQNGIEASPAGGQLEIDIRPAEGGMSIEVLDRGRGLEEGLAGRVFEPGVTTKARGSGLGLTIARALARQHRGELTLEPREGGGCVARLQIPEASSADPASAAPAEERAS